MRAFYQEGIHSVGIDRIVAEAQVTRATSIGISSCCAMAAGCRFDPALVGETFLRRVAGRLKAHASSDRIEPAGA